MQAMLRLNPLTEPVNCIEDPGHPAPSNFPLERLGNKVVERLLLAFNLYGLTKKRERQTHRASLTFNSDYEPSQLYVEGVAAHTKEPTALST
jgi:hypothetical protein